MKEILKKYRQEAEKELKNILHYWMQHTIDDDQDGFYGKIDNDNKIHPQAPKGSVLNSRILWAFSAAYNFTSNKQYLEIADRAFHYILHHFIDKEFGGVYWTVDSEGKPIDTKKQIYALAFALYGISEYAIATGLPKAKEQALNLFSTIEQYSHDTKKRGYIEALTQDWKEIKDLRLSSKDANERKSMNTHLHVLDAYANLYRIFPDESLCKNISELIELFLQHIIDEQNSHLILFFDDDWQPRSDIISYGHDIEAAWLILEAAEIIGDRALINKVKKRSVKIADATREGLDKDGGLWYEYGKGSHHLVKEKHWWVQAEAMVGFFNAWQLTGDETYLLDSFNNWQFVKENILDEEKGEWVWGIKEDHSLMKGEDKVGIWKCPYHNTRACLEIIKRIKKTNSSSMLETASNVL
jgi:mannobiose 2-epimerase